MIRKVKIYTAMVGDRKIIAESFGKFEKEVKRVKNALNVLGYGEAELSEISVTTATYEINDNLLLTIGELKNEERADYENNYELFEKENKIVRERKEKGE